jgi:hypothetical protein
MRRVYLWWFIATTVGWALATAGLPLLYIIYIIYTPLDAIISNIVNGFLVAVLQWFVLSRYLRVSIVWILAMALGWAAGAFVYSRIVPEYYYYSNYYIIGFPIGLGSALFQWLALRKNYSGLRSWLLSVVVGSTAAWAISYAVAILWYNGIISIILWGLSGGALYALITMRGLRALRRK